MGAEYERQTTFVNLPLFGDGAWTFPSLTAFLQNQPSLFLGALPGATDAARNIDEWRVTSYAQDQWRLGDRVTLNLGLRYDPRSIRDARQGSGPGRSGTVDGLHPYHGGVLAQSHAAQLGAARRHRVRPVRQSHDVDSSRYGVFHSPITANRFGPAYALNPPFALGVQVRLPFPPVPVFPTPNPSASQISQMQALDYDMADSPRLQQWNVNVQREILRNTSVTVAYVGSRGDRLQRQRDTNPVTPRTLADGTVVYGSRAGAQTISNPRVNPVFGALISANSYADSDYHSLQVGAQPAVSPTTCSRSCRTRCRDAAIRHLETRRSKVAPPPPIRTTSATTTVRVSSTGPTTCARAPSISCPSPRTRSCLDGRSRASSARSAAHRSRR